MKKIKLFQQTMETECGLCCIAMLASYFDYLQPVSYYRDSINIGRDGVSLADIYTLLEKINIAPIAYHVNNFDEDSFDSNKPYILHLKSNHYILVLKKRQGQVECYNPAEAHIKNVSICNLNKIASGYMITGTPNITFKKVNNELSEFRHFKEIVKSVIPLLLIVCFASLLAYLTSIIIPITLQHTIDSILQNGNGDILNTIFFIIGLIAIFLVISFFRTKGIVKLQSVLYEKVSSSVIQHLFKIKYSFFDNRSQGNILFRLNFLIQIQELISSNLIEMIISITSVIAIIIYFGYFFPEILLYILILIVIIFGTITFFNKKLLIYKQSEMSLKEKVDVLSTEAVNNMFQIRCLHLNTYFSTSYLNAFNEFKKKYKITQERSQIFSTLINCIFSFLPIILILLLIFAEYPYSIGSLFAMLSLLGTLFTNCFTVSSNMTSFTLIKASLFYLNDLLDEKEQKDEGEIEIKEFNNLNINNVSFKYSDNSTNVLKSINLKIRKGDKIAIVGVSGSGKTTLIKLLSGLYDPTEGCIEINGHNLSIIKKDSINKIISVVPQSPVFFNKTIKENITLGKICSDDNKLNKVLKIANLQDEIDKMPMKLNTMVSGQGGNLSGGQIQRISLARALINEPQLLIMDEATSSLDSWNERIIFNNLKSSGITQLIITHRLTTITEADEIIMLENGNIVEYGKHEELLNKRGSYYKLYTKQKEI